MRVAPSLHPVVRKGLFWSMGLGALLLAGHGSALVLEKPIEGPLTLANFKSTNSDCFDRRSRPNLPVVDVRQHVALLDRMLRNHPNLSLDLSWRVHDDQVFSDPAKRRQYVALINRWPDRFMPGTDFVAAINKTEFVYRQELAITSRILADLNDQAFRRIALGQNFFELAGLEAVAPQVCRERHS